MKPLYIWIALGVVVALVLGALAWYKWGKKEAPKIAPNVPSNATSSTNSSNASKPILTLEDVKPNLWRLQFIDAEGKSYFLGVFKNVNFTNADLTPYRYDVQFANNLAHITIRGNGTTLMSATFNPANNEIKVL